MCNDRGSFCLNDIFGCVRILGYSYCLECNNLLDFLNCTKCFDGYYLDKNGRCRPNENE